MTVPHLDSLSSLRTILNSKCLSIEMLCAGFDASAMSVAETPELNN